MEKDAIQEMISITKHLMDTTKNPHLKADLDITLQLLLICLRTVVESE